MNFISNQQSDKQTKRGLVSGAGGRELYAATNKECFADDKKAEENIFSAGKKLKMPLFLAIVSAQPAHLCPPTVQ